MEGCLIHRLQARGGDVRMWEYKDAEGYAAARILRDSCVVAVTSGQQPICSVAERECETASVL